MKDVYAAVTDRFIQQLKEGTVPWQRPWLSTQNIVSRKAYRGINSLMLGSSRYGSPFWMTFKQARDLGGMVRRGEKSSLIVYFKFYEKRKDGQIVYQPSGRPAMVPFIRWSNVFNLEQTQGIESPALTVAGDDRPPLARAEEIAQKANLCPIHHQGFSAHYSPPFDSIAMPPQKFFRTMEDYYQTLFHEMTHATGAAHRLDREGITAKAQFGSKIYAKEELIAELGASFLSNEAGILNNVRFENSTAYLANWMQRLEDDPTLIVSAASHAQRSSDWIMGIRQTEEENVGAALQPQVAEMPMEEIVARQPAGVDFTDAPMERRRGISAGS